jgi:hypothetical protein
MGYFEHQLDPVSRIEAITCPDPTPEAREWRFYEAWPEHGALVLFDHLSPAVGVVVATQEEIAAAAEWPRWRPWLEPLRVRLEVPQLT